LSIRKTLDHWPIVENLAPETPPSAAELVELRVLVDKKLAELHREVTEQVNRQNTTISRILHQRVEHFDTTPFLDTVMAPYRLLQDQLEAAETPEQVKRLIKAYNLRCAKMLSNELREALTGAKLPDSGDLFISNLNGHHSMALQLARNGSAIVPFSEALGTKETLTYAKEPFMDSTIMLLADPKETFLPGAQPHFEPRVIPEAKRMTPAKSARFFQLPGLMRFMHNDTLRKEQFFGTNLAIIAEYFCENDDALHANEITPADINRWLREKFEAHRPSIPTAMYQWLRLQGTDFAETGDHIEQYILDQIAEEAPWIFESPGITRADFNMRGGYFFLFTHLLTHITPTMTNDLERREQVRDFAPDAFSLSVFTANPLYEHVPFTQLRSSLMRLLEDLKQEYMSRLDSDLASIVRAGLHMDALPSNGWTSDKGFELLDPFAITSLSKQNRVTTQREMMMHTINRLPILPIEELRQLEREALALPDELDPKQSLLGLIRESIETKAAEMALAEVDTPTLITIADGERPPEVEGLEVPAWIDPQLVLGKGRLEPAAELEALKRSFAKVRGPEATVGFLRAHSHEMQPLDLVTPLGDGRDANRAIIDEFGWSTDIMDLLQTASILSFRGFTPDQVFAEISTLAEIAIAHTRPELAFTGIEWEQVGATPGEGRLLGPNYSWLLNLSARGADENELVTFATGNSALPRLKLKLFTDPRFGFLNIEALRRASLTPGTSPSSLHINFPIPHDLELGPTVERFFAPLKLANWFVHGGDRNQRQIAQGRISGWNRHACLDIPGTAHPGAKVELRNLCLEPDGSHLEEIEELHLIASAGIQRMRDATQAETSSSGKVMAEIFEQFKTGAESLRADNPAAAAQARKLISDHAEAVRAELSLPQMPTHTGLIITDA